MKYFGEIITAAVLCGVISALSPEDRGGVGRFLNLPDLACSTA